MSIENMKLQADNVKKFKLAVWAKIGDIFNLERKQSDMDLVFEKEVLNNTDLKNVAQRDMSLKELRLNNKDYKNIIDKLAKARMDKLAYEIDVSHSRRLFRIEELETIEQQKKGE